MKIQTTGANEYGRHVKALICGDAGAGKTLISSTFPNPIYASIEGGLMSVADRNVRFVEVTGSSDIKELGGYLRQPPEAREHFFGGPVDTVVIDTIDVLQKIYMKERLQAEHQETFRTQDWGWLGEVFRALLRGLNGLDMNVVVTCHLRDDRDEGSGTIFRNPALQGQVKDEITWMFDLALLIRTYKETEIIGDLAVPKERRVLQTFKDVQHDWIKDRSGKLPPEFPVNFDDDYKRLHAYIFGGPELAASTSVDALPIPTPEPTPAPVVVEDPPPAEKPAKPKKATKPKAPKPDPVPDPEPTPAPEATPAPAPAAEPVIDAATDVASAAEQLAAKLAESVAPVEEAEASATPDAEATTVSDPTPEPDEPVTGPDPLVGDTTGAPIDDDPDAYHGPVTCEECKTEFDDEDQWELSNIIHRRTECTTCYKNLANNS